MGNRDYKQFCAGEIYHIYNRGVGKMDIFRDASDYRLFLDRLKENLFPELVDKSKLSRLQRKRKMLPSNSFELISYCLMPNHFHILITERIEGGISTFMQKLSTAYAMYYNKKYENSRIR